ncbi:MAG: DUF4230 domain-containing protein [Clostridia bacterium]|nr:DUF4230 domain-containing protein [Clostridia bacterium]
MKESRWIKRFTGFITRHSGSIAICLGILFVILSYFFRFGSPGQAGKTSITTSSSLTDAIDIAELSTAEFRYRGIAEIYKDESRKQVQCRVCYNAVVKAGIDMKNVRFDIDPEQKVVSATLPEIDLKVTIVDEQSMALLPSDADVGIDSMLKCSREDAENEARESEELISTARENLKATIEGLIYPILKADGYALSWN